MRSYRRQSVEQALIEVLSLLGKICQMRLYSRVLTNVAVHAAWSATYKKQRWAPTLS